MSFYTRYELERLIADGEAKTFRATESATGRIVFLHLFNPSGQALLADLKAKLVGTGGKPVPPLLEIGEFAGSQYAVTEFSEPFSGLRDWVSRQPAPAPASRPPAPPVAAAPSRGLLDEEPGEFTKLFPPSAPASRPAAPPVAAAPPRGLLDEEPGEFTKLFPPSAPASRPPAQQEAGDFTRAFGGIPPKAPDRAKPPARMPPLPPSPPPLPLRREAPAPPGASAGLPAPADTGEFTKLFGSGLSGEAIDIAGEQAKAARAAVNESRPFQQAGQFTRMFGPEMGAQASAGPPPAAPLSLNTSASGVFGSPLDPAEPKPPGSPSDPGEYTGIFGAKPKPSEPPTPPAAAKPAPVVPIAAAKPKMQPAVIAGVVAAVLVLAALIVLAIVLSTRSH